MLDDFLMRALLAGIGLAMVTGPAGCFIVWRRLAYFGETIAHSALLGVAIAVLVNLHLVIGIFVTAVAVVLAMSYLERRDTLPTDTLLGLLSHGGLAVGLVLLSFFPGSTFRACCSGIFSPCPVSTSPSSGAVAQSRLFCCGGSGGPCWRPRSATTWRPWPDCVRSGRFSCSESSLKLLTLL